MINCGDIFTILTTIVVAIITVAIAISVFKKTSTLQVEMFIHNAYKNYMEIMLNNEDYKKNAITQFLMAIDLYCKFVINGHLDKKLSDDNLDFFRGVIIIFKDTIKADLENYNNINDYIKKYHISLDERESGLDSPISQTLYS